MVWIAAVLLRRHRKRLKRHAVRGRPSGPPTRSERPDPMTALLSDTRNFRQVDERLLTAGQPDEGQLADAARQGVQIVINLALHDDPRYSLADEAGCVRGLGMEYAH